MHRIHWLALTLALLTPACSDPVAPVTPTPVEPTITEVFQGALLVLGSNTHPFGVQQVGGLKVTISEINPDSTVFFGVGAQSPFGCTLISQLKREPGGTSQISGTITQPGTFCVMVFDSGGVLVEPINYTVTVLHS
jgi:hypothetical protein